MTQEKSVVARGVFPNKTELTRFLDMFKEQPVAHHQSKKMEVAIKGRKRHITLYLKDWAVFMLKNSLRDGMLYRWRERFKIDGSA